MPTEFLLPELGENVESGDIVRVLVSVGDTLVEDQSVLEVETGKAVVEVPSTLQGRVTAVHVAEGESIKVGEPVFTIEESGVEEAPERVELEAGEAVAAPIEAVSDAEQGVKAAPEAGEEAPAPALAEGKPPTELPEERTRPPIAAAIPARERQREPVLAPPSVRQFAREVGVDIYDVEGSGPAGRISIEDVKRHVRETVAGRAPAPAGVAGGALGWPSAVESLPDFSAFGPIEREAMSNVRQATAEHLSRSWALIPHVTQFDTADATDLEQLRKAYQEKAERAGGKLTITAILVKILAGALRRFPQFSASVDMAQREIVYKKFYHIGVAVDTDRGLVVPVLRDVDRKSIIEVAIELGEIAQRARERKIRPEDLQGGCLTISNLGGLGSKHFAPIINYPEVAILGVGRATTQPVYVNDELVPRFMLPLGLSYDHRLIDGADGTHFLRWIVEAIEQPFLLSLEG